MYPKAIISSFLVTCLLAGAIGAKKDSHGPKWGYAGDVGPKFWEKAYPKCAGDSQSPIDIVTKDAMKDDKLGMIEFTGYETKIKDAKIKNNGHTVQLWDDDTSAAISGGGLPGTFQFQQLHFHWGGDNKDGSEHSIDGHFYPLEMHLVHKNKRYSSVSEAMKHKDGLAVLGILFEVSDKDNEELQPLIEGLDDIVEEGTETVLKDDFDIDQLIPDDTLPYYRYEGSLTTPDCSEAVVWTVFGHTQHISTKQLEQFRILKETSDGDDDTQMEDNFRPVQDLNGRTVKVSTDTGDVDDPDEDEKTEGSKQGGCQIVPSTLILFGIIAGALHTLFQSFIAPVLCLIM